MRATAISSAHNLYIVCGAGVSGRAATRWLLHHKRKVLLYDADTVQLGNPALRKLAAAARLQVTAQLTRVLCALPRCTMFVVSPGIGRDHPLLAAARAQGVNICSEVALGLPGYRGEIAAVTGTNGKSTVCAMLQHILQQLPLPSALCGNIGTAVSEVLLPTRPVPPRLVIELSSFQLEHTRLPALTTAIFTNFGPSHLARHGSADAYFALKQKLFAALAPEGLAICDTSVRAKLKTLPANLTVVTNSALEFLADDKILRSYPLHDRCNAMMALLAAQKFSGLHLTQLVPHLRTWCGLPYRLQLVGYLAGQPVINDSKATDSAATLAALRAQREPVQLIYGGTTVQGRQLLTQRAKIAAMHVFGTERRQLCMQLRTHFPVRSFPNLAALLARLPQTCMSTPLLFSPACISPPEFVDFMARGKFFDAALRKMDGFTAAAHLPKTDDTPRCEAR